MTTYEIFSTTGRLLGITGHHEQASQCLRDWPDAEFVIADGCRIAAVKEETVSRHDMPEVLLASMSE